MDISELSQRQLTNARMIYNAAKPFGGDAVLAALMTAGDEASWLRYANNGQNTRTDVPQWAKDLAALSLQFPHDAVAGEAWTTADSIGLFQQRLMYGYSSRDLNGVADLMDPAVSTIIFLKGSSFGKTKAFMDSPVELTLAQRCQWTQGSEFPDGVAYAPFESVAAQLIDRFGAIDQPKPKHFDILDWVSNPSII